MASAVQRFTRRAQEEFGLDLVARRYPEGTRTAADAAAAIGCDVAQIVKSLVFVADEDQVVLALTSGANRVDEAALAAAVGAASIRKANADEARDATGFAIGGTPPFGHDTVLRTFIDPDLLTFDEVWAAAGTPNDNVALHPEDIVRVTGAVVADFAADRDRG